MTKDNISVHLNADILEKINLFTENNGQDQADFINELLDNALNQHLLVQSGGFVLTVPNVQFYHIDKEKALACIDEVINTSNACTHANIPNGLMAFAEYLKTRLFADTQERKDFFKSNLEMRTSATSTKYIQIVRDGGKNHG